MSLLGSLRSAFLGGGLDLRATRALNLVGDTADFVDLNDPYLAQFMSEGRRTSSGVTVNERMALKNSSLFRAACLISGSVGMLPLHLYQLQTFSRKVPADELSEGDKATLIAT